MLSMFFPVLSTPLLKIPLLASNALLTYTALTPPNPPPKSSELSKYEEPDVISRGRFNWLLRYCTRPMALAKALAEVAVILAKQYPSTLSDSVLSLLLPSSTGSGVQTTKMFLAGWVFICAGGLLRLWCYRALGRFFTYQLSVKHEHQLITVGPYAIVRHPSYTGMIMLAIGNFLWANESGSWWANFGSFGTVLRGTCIAIWATYWTVVAPLVVSRLGKEDRILKKEFGNQWEEWSRSTPYKLVPFIY
ncbi:hypothetical protein BKA93DRAFT_787307 [Sparassis latifolia]